MEDEKNIRCGTEEVGALETGGSARKNVEVAARKQFGDVCRDATWSSQAINAAIKPVRRWRNSTGHRFMGNPTVRSRGSTTNLGDKWRIWL